MVTVQTAGTSGTGGQNNAENSEGRERYPIDIPYQRDSATTLRRCVECRSVLYDRALSGAQIPLDQGAKISFTHGFVMSREEDGAYRCDRRLRRLRRLV